MSDHRRSTSRSTSQKPSANVLTRLAERNGTPNTPALSPRAPSSLTIAPRQKKIEPPRPPSLSLPPRGYLRQYELNRIRARAEEIAPWVPNGTSSKKTPHPVVRELLFPLALAQRGGVSYGLHLGGALILIAAAASLAERVVVSVLLYSGFIWELPIVIAPFVSLVIEIGLRVLALPIVVGLFSLPVRALFCAGSLDLVTLCDTTPHAVRRSCSTTWVVSLKLLRRLLALIIGVSGIILTSRTAVPPSIVLLLTVSFGFSYLIFRIPLLCAPILSVVADYGRRYAVHQVGTILHPCANKIRFAVCGFVLGWFTSHLILRSLVGLLGMSPWPFALWINLCLWIWYSVSCIASMILHRAFLYERMVSQRESSVADPMSPMPASVEQHGVSSSASPLQMTNQHPPKETY